VSERTSRAAFQYVTIATELDAFLADLQERRGRAPNTINAYRYDLRAAAHALPQPLAAITPSQIEEFLSSRHEKPSTSNRRLASLKRFFSWARKAGLCHHNPADLVETIHDEERLPRPIRGDDLRTLDAALAKAPPPYRLIFTLLRETGMRADEVLSLDVGDVNLEPGREGLRVREAKNSHERTVVLDADVMKRSLRLLRAQLREQGPLDASVPLFRSNRGTRVAYDSLYYQWQQLYNVPQNSDTKRR
jgi:integrase/recombinase XerD